MINHKSCPFNFEKIPLRQLSDRDDKFKVRLGLEELLGGICLPTIPPISITSNISVIPISREAREESVQSFQSFFKT